MLHLLTRTRYNLDAAQNETKEINRTLWKYIYRQNIKKKKTFTRRSHYLASTANQHSIPILLINDVNFAKNITRRLGNPINKPSKTKYSAPWNYTHTLVRYAKYATQRHLKHLATAQRQNARLFPTAKTTTKNFCLAPKNRE